MGHAFPIKQDDLLPPLEGAAVARATGEPLDMAGATAAFRMRASGADGAIVATGVATIMSATTLNASGMNLRYEWATGQTATVGHFQADFKLRYPSGRNQTVPGVGFVGVRVDEDID